MEWPKSFWPIAEAFIPKELGHACAMTPCAVLVTPAMWVTSLEVGCGQMSVDAGGNSMPCEAMAVGISMATMRSGGMTPAYSLCSKRWEVVGPQRIEETS
jgi:hypothetical protein